MGRRLGAFAFVAAGAFFVFIFAFLVVAVGFVSAVLSTLENYPFASIYWAQAAGYAVFAAALLGLASLVPAWGRSGWSLWRKAHHTAFVLSLALFGVMLIVWNAIFSAPA